MLSVRLLVNLTSAVGGGGFDPDPNFPVWCASRVKTRLSVRASDGRTGVEILMNTHTRRHLATTTITVC